MTREEAIEVYHGLLNQKIREAFEVFAPELRESEDERIRKALITLTKVPRKEIFEAQGITKEQALAWLEKQKEQKPADLVKEEYIKNRNDGTYTCDTTNDGFDAFMDGFNKGYELGIKEQTKKQ